MQLYFLLGFLFLKEYLFKELIQNITNKIGFKLERSYKNDDDLYQKLPKDEFERDIFMAISFFRKYPNNIVDHAYRVKDKYEYKWKIDKTKEDLIKEFEEHKYQLQPVELKPEASSACRKNLK